MKYLAALLALTITSAHGWEMQTTPPLMGTDRTWIFLDPANMTPSVSWPDDRFCQGLYYDIQLADGEDAYLNQSIGVEPLRYPLRITGGRNVHIVGVSIVLDVQEGCDVGDLPNFPVAEWPNANIHPRPPLAHVLYMQQSGTSYLEGLLLDANGQQADCIIGRNPDSMTDNEARDQRHYVIQNTRCQGVEGHSNQAGHGDGIHGDLFQNQGNDIFNTLTVENVTMRTSYEGIVTHGSGGANDQLPKTVILRRYNYGGDLRFIGDDVLDGNFGLAGEIWSDRIMYEDVSIQDPRTSPLDYLLWNGNRYGIGGSDVTSNPDIGNQYADYAPLADVGLAYVRPDSTWVYEETAQYIAEMERTVIAVDARAENWRFTAIQRQGIIDDLEEQLAQCN